jgi:hypothetical protein
VDELNYFVNGLLRLNKNIKLILNYVVGPLVFCLLLYSIYRQVRNQMNWEQSLHQLREAISPQFFLLFSCVFLLMLINWSLEARKWQLLMQRVYPISWMRSLKATLTGLTFAFFTPNRMGEYVGRVVYIQKGKRITAASLTLVSSMAQISVTLLFGLAGLIQLKSHLRSHLEGVPSASTWIDALIYMTLLGLIVLKFFYLRLSWFFYWIGKIPQLERLHGIVKLLETFDIYLLSRIWVLSVARFMVFITQYYLLFEIFRVRLELWEVVWSVSIVFLVLAILPSIAFLTDLGIRWKTSLDILNMFSANSVGILAASLTVWVINLVLPALAGSLLLLNIRIFRMRAQQGREAGASTDPEEASNR